MPSPLRKGFHCPECKARKKPLYRILFTYRTRRPTPHLITRYRECRECGYRIVTEERQLKVARPAAVPKKRLGYNPVPKKSA